MKLKIKDMNGKSVGDVSVSKDVFGIEPNLPVVRQAILSELNNMGQGTHSAKNRAMVSGGGKKPWKQKGRGVARAGTIRSPLWKGGGTVFGPEPHDYNHKLPKTFKTEKKIFAFFRVYFHDLVNIIIFKK